MRTGVSRNYGATPLAVRLAVKLAPRAGFIMGATIVVLGLIFIGAPAPVRAFATLFWWFVTPRMAAWASTNGVKFDGKADADRWYDGYETGYASAEREFWHGGPCVESCERYPETCARQNGNVENVDRAGESL